jgi:hypothetical protein
VSLNLLYSEKFCFNKIANCELPFALIHFTPQLFNYTNCSLHCTPQLLCSTRVTNTVCNSRGALENTGAMQRHSCCAAPVTRYAACHQRGVVGAARAVQHHPCCGVGTTRIVIRATRTAIQHPLTTRKTFLQLQSIKL